MKILRNKNNVNMGLFKTDSRFDLVEEKDAFFGDFRNRAGTIPAVRGKPPFGRGAGYNSGIRGNWRQPSHVTFNQRPSFNPMRPQHNFRGSFRPNNWSSQTYNQKQGGIKPINPLDKAGSRMAHLDIY